MSKLQCFFHVFCDVHIIIDVQSCQVSDCDKKAFCVNENRAWPPSMALNGMMHHARKSDLLECLESIAVCPVKTLKFDVKIIDSALLIHVLDPSKACRPIMTYIDYSQIVFLPYIRNIL